MNRLPALVALALVGVFSMLATAQTPRAFSVVEATIPEMQRAMSEGRTTSRELVRLYLTRIGTYDHQLHAVLAVNPKALEEAAVRDRERAGGHVRGALHGIPVALKDNIQTTMMPTTGGALAFERFVPPYEATLVANLRAAGAVIIAKTGMTELANWVAGDPTPMPTNYNAIGRFGFNPYDPRRDPRDATFDGRPALRTGGQLNIGLPLLGGERRHRNVDRLQPFEPEHLAGIKPTVGRTSRYGVIPIRRIRTRPGRWREPAVNGAPRWASLKPRRGSADPATRTCPASGPRLHAYLRTGALKTHRDSSRSFFDRVAQPERPSCAIARRDDAQQAVMAEAIAVLKKQGAVVIDPATPRRRDLIRRTTPG
jgi:amidase